jgi:putative aldouronate transport system substrate-binding protein
MSFLLWQVPRCGKNIFFQEKCMKKLVVVVLCALIALSSVTAGGRGQSSTAAKTAVTVDRSNLNALGTYPLVKNKETLNIWMSGAVADPAYPFEENWFSQFMENKTNVHFNRTYAADNQFKEKLNLALASGEQIDAVITGGSAVQYSRGEILRLAEQQLVLPIQDYIGTDTINMQKGWTPGDPYFKENLKEVFTTPDGNMYFFPAYNSLGHWTCYGKLWVNKVWLDNLGLKEPTTTEEFRQMLIAFRDKDANGNGDPTDEIPFAGAVDAWWTTKVDPFLMSAFILDDGENRTFLENGKVVTAYTRPEFRDGLRYLAQLYSEKLIYPDSFTMSQDARNKLGSTKYESIIGAAPNGHHYGFGIREDGEPVRWNEYVPIAPLKGPKGVQTTRYDFYPTNEQNSGWIPATSRNPALVMRYVDFFYTEESVIPRNYGAYGISYTDADPGATGESGLPATLKRLEMKEGDPFYNNMTWGNGFPGYANEKTRNLRQEAPDMYAPDGTGTERMLYTMTYKNYVPYAQPLDSIIPPLWYSIEDASNIAMLTTNINTYVEECIAKFITGQMNLDADWDRFQAQLRSLGVDQYVKIIQDAYDKSPLAKK